MGVTTVKLQPNHKRFASTHTSFWFCRVALKSDNVNWNSCIRTSTENGRSRWKIVLKKFKKKLRTYSLEKMRSQEILHFTKKTFLKCFKILSGCRRNFRPLNLDQIFNFLQTFWRDEVGTGLTKYISFVAYLPKTRDFDANAVDSRSPKNCPFVK